MRQVPPLIIQIAILLSSSVGMANFSLAVYRFAAESKDPQPAIIIVPIRPTENDFPSHKFQFKQ